MGRKLWKLTLHLTLLKPQLHFFSLNNKKKLFSNVNFSIQTLNFSISSSTHLLKKKRKTSIHITVITLNGITICIAIQTKNPGITLYSLPSLSIVLALTTTNTNINNFNKLLICLPFSLLVYFHIKQ